MRSAERGEIVDLADYLRRLGLDRFAPLDAPIACDVCGAADAQAVRHTVRVTRRIRTRFATLCCRRCGLLFQAPRFAPAFYDAYYARVYRVMVGGSDRPSGAYVADQVARGAALFDALQAWLPARGRLLDVGCGTGAMMTRFRERGWSVCGVDPDRSAVAYGVERLGLPVVAGEAETMTVERGGFDLIVIAGSLEHVRDPGAVLRRCHEAAARGSLLLLEAHGLGQAAQLGAIGHNHRRLLTGATMAALLLAHGWEVVWSTDRPLCGPTRPGSVFTLGRRLDAPVAGALDAALDRGVRETPEAMAALLDRWGIG